jgi:hypothetical protein
MVRQITQWLTRDRLNFFCLGLLLAQLALFAGIESTSGVLDRLGRVRGRDFLHFYIAGRLVARGGAGRLYDQDHFLGVQQTIVEINDNSPPYLSVYPPTTALLFSPLGRLPYGTAVVLWWLTQAACFLVSGYLLLRQARLAPRWRLTACLALAAFSPVISTFWNGQLSAFLLLVFVGGLWLRRRERCWQAGCVLSLLALKPQLALGVGVWLLLRRDLRTGAGFCLGLLLQAGFVVTALGPAVLADYAGNGPALGRFAQLYSNTADHQHATAGILFDLLGWRYQTLCNLAHLAVAGCAGLLFWKFLRSRRAVAGGGEGADAWRFEESALVLFSLLLAPHLLTYDLSLLLIPAVNLWIAQLGGDREEMPIGVMLYLFATLCMLYLAIGFSLVPLALLWGLYRLARLGPPLPGPLPPPGSPDPCALPAPEPPREYIVVYGTRPMLWVWSETAEEYVSPPYLAPAGDGL